MKNCSADAYVALRSACPIICGNPEGPAHFLGLQPAGLEVLCVHPAQRHLGELRRLIQQQHTH
jgi:hypothetical protein